MQANRELRNAVLASLSPGDWQRIQPAFTNVHLRHGELLADADSRLQRVHFPITAVVSTSALMADGSSVEMATAGREGVAEIGAILGSNTALTQHVTQVAGSALVMSYDAFCYWRQEMPDFARLLSSYAQANYIQVLRTVACNARHSVQQRSARWLLACRDRRGSDTFPLTQAFLAEMLGVSRGQVNLVFRGLERDGLVRGHRGRIALISSNGLQEIACECYGVIRQAFNDRSLYL